MGDRMSSVSVPRIHADMNVEDLIDRFPAVASVFVRRRMQCVGCSMARFETVAEVCRIYRQPLETMLADLQEALTGDAR